MTVRKWIDRSIAGLETRSGDYPVMNTKNVAIIIMLSGLENIPRITELKEIQVQYKASRQDSVAGASKPDSDTISVYDVSGIVSAAGASTRRESTKIKDENLILPVRAHQNKESPYSDSGSISDWAKEDYPPGIETAPPAIRRKISSEREIAEKKPAPQHITKPQIIEEVIPSLPADDMSIQDASGSHAPRHRVVVAKDHLPTGQSPPHTKSHEFSVHGIPQGKKFPYAKDSRGFDEKHLPHSKDERLRTKEIERQIIEKELQRQRTMAISGRTIKTGSEASIHTKPSPEIVRLKHEVTDKILKKENVPPEPDEVVQQIRKKRTVVMQKKKVHPVTHEANEEVSVGDDDQSVTKRHVIYSIQADPEDSKVSIKNSANKSKDEIFEGKHVQRPARQVRDSALVHTDLKSKKKPGEPKEVESEPGNHDHIEESSKAPKKREKNITKKDDISWI
jgi:hypothetical protein